MNYTNTESSTQIQDQTHKYKVKNTNTKFNTQSYRECTRSNKWWEMEYTNETAVVIKIELEMGTIYVQVPQILHSSSK